jgi:hypothetical protein
MSFALLLPVGLAALAALLVPILIHLIRRPEHRLTDFPALRWLAERARPRRRLRFDDPWLLLLRLILLALIAVLLARPVVVGEWRSARNWIAVAPGVDIGKARAELAGVQGEWHWLAPGFPTIDSAVPRSEVALSSLIRELDADLAKRDRLIVVVPTEIDGLDGESLRLGRAVDWHIVEGRSMPRAVPVAGNIRHIAVRHGAASEPGLRYLRAAVAAWNAHNPGRSALDEQPLEVAVPGDTPWLIWLDAPLSPAISAWIERGGQALIVDPSMNEGAAVLRDGKGDVLAREKSIGAGRLIAFLHPLTPSSLPILLDAQFPDRLRELFEGPPSAPTRALAATVKPVLAETSLSPARFPLDSLLVMLIGLVFLIERFMAMRRRSPS